MSPPWMLVRLALETSIHHQQADDDRLAAIEIRTLDEYRYFLRPIYGFEAAVEAAIARAEVEPMFTHGRFKADFLRAEFDLLGVPWPTALAPVTIRSAAHAMGWLFVLERHTLLAGLIRRHIVRTLDTPATRYLAAYEDAPGIRFRALGEALGVYAQRQSPRNIILGANEAFRAQRQWYGSPQRDEDVREPQSTTG